MGSVTIVLLEDNGGDNNENHKPFFFQNEIISGEVYAEKRYHISFFFSLLGAVANRVLGLLSDFFRGGLGWRGG